MKAAHYVRFCALAALLGPVAIACSDAADDPGAEAPDAAADGALVVPSGDAADPADAISDASVEADADAALRTCTDEGWCHTVVPGGQTLRAVWGDGAGSVWTVSQEGNILRWDGAAWVQSFAAGVPLYAIWGSGPTDLWAGGGALTMQGMVLPGVLLHGTGASPSAIVWKTVAAPLTIRSIWGTSATNVWAAASLTQRVVATDPSFLLHYTGADADAGPPDAGDAGDGGVGVTGPGWAIDPATTTLPAHYEKVWGTGPSDVWVSGRVAPNSFTTKGQVIHRTSDGDGGVAWRKEQPTTTDSARADTFGFSFSASLAYLVGFSSDFSGNAYFHVGKSDPDAGAFAWTQHAASETGFSTNALSVLWGSGPNDIWVAGTLGRLRHFDGAAWHVAVVAVDDNAPTQNAVYGIWGSGPDDVWVVGTDLALHKTAGKP